MSSVKEPHYFSVASRMARGAAWYDSLFEDAGPKVKIFGESSTSYSVWEPSLVRIRNSLQNPRIIVIMRHPLERLLSHYRWMYALGFENRNLKKALVNEANSVVSPERHINGCYPWYRRCSHYSYFVPLMQMVFEPENVLLLRSSTLLDSPNEALRKCFEFLGVAPFNVQCEIRTNATDEKVVAKYKGLRRVVRRLPSFVHAPIKLMESHFNIGPRRLIAPVPTESFLESLSLDLAEDIEYYENV